MKRFLGFLAVLCFLFSACIQTNTVRLGQAIARQPVLADQVVIYRTADQVPGKYEEVALIHAKGEATWTTERGMFEALRKSAGKLGANGIILEALSEPSAGAKIAGAFLGTGAQRTGKVVAIFVHKD